MKNEQMQYQVKEGYVAIIDFLGVGSFNTDDAIGFLKKREIILNSLESINEKISIMIDSGIVKFFKPPEIATFGDTLILCWEWNNNNNNDNNNDKNLIFKNLYLYLTTIFCISIRNKLYPRGAFSYGEYIFDKETNTIIGEVVSDVANWYEVANFIGIYATPKCFFLINKYIGSIQNTVKENELEEFFTKYEIPVKYNSTTIKTYCINWVTYFKEIKDKDINYKNLLAKITSCFNSNIPKGTEEKYYNTLKYVEYCEKLKNN